jgi:hypothetical protein
MSIETVNDLSGLLTESALPPLVLEPTDHCDQCGPVSQALVAVRLKSGGELRFCGHHFRANELSLITVVDVVTTNGSTWGPS